MTRILILIVIGFILVKILKRIIAGADSKPSAKDEPSTNDKASKASADEKMIQCAKCGCHVPISESISKNNQQICNNPECQP